MFPSLKVHCLKKHLVSHTDNRKPGCERHERKDDDPENVNGTPTPMTDE